MFYNILITIWVVSGMIFITLTNRMIIKSDGDIKTVIKIQKWYRRYLPFNLLMLGIVFLKIIYSTYLRFSQ